MYPQPDLIRLAAHKAALRRTITLHRGECVRAATGATRPLAWLDRMLAFWRRLPPFATFAAVPLGLLAARTVFPRLKLLGTFLRWGPVIFSALRGISSGQKPRAASARSPAAQG